MTLRLLMTCSQEVNRGLLKGTELQEAHENERTMKLAIPQKDYGNAKSIILIQVGLRNADQHRCKGVEKSKSWRKECPMKKLAWRGKQASLCLMNHNCIQKTWAH